MLSYRHGFHAGNHADVLKHLVFVQILQSLHKKPAALCCIDTHAGAGSYDLRAKEAEKVGEFRAGIEKVWQAPAPPALIQTYLDAVCANNPSRPDELRYYPGSPALAHHFLRPQDRMVLIERHPSDHARLDRIYAPNAACRVELGDGYTLLKAFVPPREKRGVVLIDPAYELKTEYQDLLDSLTAAYQRWATGVYVIWYPHVARAQTGRLLKRIAASGLRRILKVELALTAPRAEFGLWGSGLLIVNPPYELDVQIAAILPWLRHILGATSEAPAGVNWLVPE